MTPPGIHQTLVAKFGDKITGANLEALDPWIEVAPAAIADVAEFLKTEKSLEFDALNNLCGVDYLEPDAKKAAKFGHEPHVEVVYHLYSYTHRHAIVVKVKVPRWKGNAAGQLPEGPSVSGVRAIAGRHERRRGERGGVNSNGQ